jgi:hypothetical protein
LDKLKETGKKKEGKEVFLDGQMTNRNVNKWTWRVGENKQQDNDIEFQGQLLIGFVLF